MATVSVRGTGTAKAQPDEVVVGLLVEALRPSASEAFAEAARLAQEVSALCDSLGIPAGARTTTRVSLAEHGEHTAEGWQHRGYRASSRLVVTLGDGELASGLVTEAAARDDTRIDGPGWRVRHDNPARTEARRLAAEDARRKAEEYAGVLGARVGAIASIDEPETKPGTAGGAVGARMRLQADSAMPIEAGEHEVVAEVDVTFQLEQG